MAVGSLKMSIRVSKEERLNGGGPVPPLRGRWALRYKPLPGSLRAGGGWNHLGAIGREETIHGQTGAAVRCTKSEGFKESPSAEAGRADARPRASGGARTQPAHYPTDTAAAE